MTDPPRWTRLDLGILAFCAALGAATRAALRSSAYYSVDAGLFATAALDYDFAEGQPHPPYYPLVVASMHVLTPWMDPLSALAWIAVAASAVIAGGTYAVARCLSGRPTAAFAAFIVLASPLALRNGTIPLSYALEGAASVAVAFAAWMCRRRPTVATALALGVLLSVAVGIRPSSAVLLAPLGLWATWGAWRPLGWTVLAGAATTAAWFLPALAFGGGWSAFLAGVQVQSESYVLVNPVWDGGPAVVGNHAAWLLHHARGEAPFFALLAAACVVATLRVRGSMERRPVAFLAAWLLPGLAFYLLVYAGWPVYADGYLMALLPGAAVLAALATRALVAAVQGDGVPRAAQAVGLGLVFLIAVQPTTWLGQWPEAMADARRAEAWEDSLRGFEDEFPVNETAIVSFYGAQWTMLRHPDHLLWSLYVYGGDDGLVHTHVRQSVGTQGDPAFFEAARTGIDAPRHPVPDRVQRIVLIEGHPFDPMAPLLVPGVETHETQIAGGRTVTWVYADGIGHIEDILAYVQNGPIPYARSFDPPK
jgi:uncharacterized membrane protein (UPF0136 family)